VQTHQAIATGVAAGIADVQCLMRVFQSLQMLQNLSACSIRNTEAGRCLTATGPSAAQVLRRSATELPDGPSSS
jgi:hypothetical protein